MAGNEIDTTGAEMSFSPAKVTCVACEQEVDADEALCFTGEEPARFLCMRCDWAGRLWAASLRSIGRRRIERGLPK